jgi:FkbM family methyltransferase
MFYSQHGEEKILSQFFGDKNNGFLVDIGAMDGVTYSNSRYLIEHKSWSGILVEPHPLYYKNLSDLYKDNDKISILNVGCFNVEKEVDFYIYSTGIDSSVSTMSDVFKKRVIDHHGDKFRETITVKTQTLNNIISNNVVDFLSIDAEGVDMEVLESNNWTKNRPRLVCVEHSMDINVLLNFMMHIEYSVYSKTDGNTFFISS